MQNWESAAASYAAQQQAMGFPNMGTEDPYAGQQFGGQDAGAWQQWQQEYAQWQAQYGEQYEQAMKGMQMNPKSLEPNAHPPPPPPEESGPQQGNFRGGRGGRGAFRGAPRAGRGGQRGGGGNQSWGGNQQTPGWAGSNQQQQDFGGNQQQNWNKNQQQNNWGGGNQQKWGNQNQQDQPWNQQNQQSGWGAGDQQNFNNRGTRGPRGGGRGRGGPARGNFNNAQGGQFQGNEPQWPQQQFSPKVPPGVDFNKGQPPPPPPPEEKKPIPSATQPISAGLEELSKTEKEFDDQFKSWEDQFNTWKEQNKNHPDKDQYAEYEIKMEKFRAQLLARRELMRKKREIEESKAGIKVSPNKPSQLNAPHQQQVPQPLITREDIVKNQAAKAFADNWAKEPPMEKPKGKSIQDTLLEMANYIAPKTNSGPTNATPDKQPKKGASGIPGLDLGRDSFQIKEEVKPPGTEISPKKPPPVSTPPVKVEGKNQPPPLLGSQVKPPGASPTTDPARNPVKDGNFSSGGPNRGGNNSGPGFSGPGGNFKNQRSNVSGGGPPGALGRLGKQGSFENYDEFGDDSQDMAAMHERFAEDEDVNNFRGPGSFQGPNEFRGPGGPPENMRGPGPNNNNFRGPGGPNNNFRGPGGPNENFRGPGGPQDNFRGPGGPQDNFSGPGGPNDNFRGPGGPQDSFRGRGGPSDNVRDRGGPDDNFRGPGGPNDNFRGPGGPNNNFRGPGGPPEKSPGGPSDNFKGPGGPSNSFRGSDGPPDNFRGQGGPPENFRGQGGPPDNCKGQGGPPENFRGPGGDSQDNVRGGREPSDNFRGPDNFRGGPSDDFRGSDPKNQLNPTEQAGSIPNDFNPWIDLGSDDELPPELCERGAPNYRGRDGSPMGRGMNWQDGPSFNNDDGRPPFRDDFDRGPMGRGRMPFNNFDERDMGRPMNDRNNMRGPPFHPDDRFGDFRDDRGFAQNRDGPGPGGWNQDREWMARQRVRQEWENEEEYKAKTVIEYDHQPLNVITPALTPANVNPSCKKKVIFKEPAKITDYSHSSEAEPTVLTSDPFDYDRTKYVKWDEEERKRKERERDRDMWMQEDRRYQRQRDFDRNADRNQDRNIDRNQDRNVDRNQDRNVDRNQDRNVDRNQDRNLDRNPRNREREEVRGRDRDDFRDRERDFRDRERHNPRDRDRDRERPDSRNQDDSRDSRPQRSPSPRSGPSHSRGRGNRDMPEKRPQDSSQSHRDTSNRNQQQSKQQPPQPGKKLFNIPVEVDTTQVEDLLCLPGRVQRPSKFAIFMRGPSGSGKSFAAKLIKDKEVENGGNAPRILSLDDYFMTEVEKEVQDPETGRKVKSKVMQYEYEVEMEEPYRASLTKAFKKTVDEGYFPIIIVDCVHDKVIHFEEMWRFAQSKNIKCFVVEMEADAQKCANQTEHGRSLQDIEKSIKSWEPAPSGITRLDITSLLQKASINEVEMEDLTDDDNETGEEAPFSALVDLPTSKWDKLDSEDKLAKLDGIKKSNKSKESLTMDDWLGLEEMNDAPLEPGKKRVRWADLVERKEQEKMRAIGFVVGQTDWNRMMDPTFGGGALTKTKYI